MAELVLMEYCFRLWLNKDVVTTYKFNFGLKFLFNVLFWQLKLSQEGSFEDVYEVNLHASNVGTVPNLEKVNSFKVLLNRNRFPGKFTF